MIILGIETSCDDTSIAIVEDGSRVLSNIVSSQIKDHQKFGGIVPEIAARKHIENILPVLDLALKEAKCDYKNIDAIAVTYRPGLIGSLVVGLAVAKALAYYLNIPLVGIDHIEAHMYANCLFGVPPESRHLALVVSGGHTQIIERYGTHGYKIIGQTVDDAAGEAFDKVAKMLKLGFPGGPIIQRIAEKGDPNAIAFPRPLIDSPDFRLSFSGLKTAVLVYIRKNPSYILENVCASFQEAVADVLVKKTIKAAKKFNHKIICISGGVSANKILREKFNSKCKENDIKFFVPPVQYCTDNGAMVAGLAYHKLKKGIKHCLDLNAFAN